MERPQPSGTARLRAMGIFGAVYGRVRGVELCKDGHDRFLFAELLLQGDGAGLWKDRPAEHALP